tara:strand:+ start:8188 stop:8718 length:531 start_codon:yes stop_codon:yes gene_type:complete
MEQRQSHLLYSRFTVADDDGAFKSPMARQLLAYWRDKAGDRRRPAWTDLSLMDVYGIASNIMVRDTVDGGRDFRCRFCGTKLVSVLGMEPTGRLLDESYAPEGRDMMLARYHLVLSADAPVRVVGYVRVVEKNLPTGFECVMLPVSDADGDIGHVMMVLDFTYDPQEDEVPAPGLS